MNILAIETSQPSASLCLFSAGKVVHVSTWKAERNHDAHLFPALQKAIDMLGQTPALDYVLVGAGPGSYGGVRVALAAGVGIATVTGARLVAIESWAQFSDDRGCIVADARRGGWTVRYPDGRIDVLDTPQLKALEIPVYTVEKPGALQEKGIAPVQKEGLIPTAEGIVETWLGMTPQEQAETVFKPAEPIYVRPPHITKSTRKPWEI